MSHNYLKEATSTVETPQSQPIPGKTQVANQAGGYVFAVDDWKRMERFLILGSEGATYYATERKMTLENVGSLERCLQADGDRYIKTILDISESGRAPKNDPALLALALAFSKGDQTTRGYAAAILPRVARIGTHLFHWADFVNSQRGWGRGLKAAVAQWYLGKDLSSLAHQIVKYQSRDNWSHRDLIRLAHPDKSNPLYDDLFAYVTKGAMSERMIEQKNPLFGIIFAFEELKKIAKPPSHSKDDEKWVVKLIRECRLPRECVPTEWLNSCAVWEALLESMPPTAMIRNLGKMTSIGLLAPLSNAAKFVTEKINDIEALRKAKVHPIQILLALATYKSGHGMKGSLSWSPVQPIVAALDAAFYTTFKLVQPTGKRFYIALDVSGSMGIGQVASTPLTPCEAAAALAMVTMRTEQQWHVVGFTNGDRPSMHSRMGYNSGITDLALNPSMNLDAAVRYTSNLQFGGTDCALPMVDAMARNLNVDAFYVLTDSETWAGSIHPCQALKQYRQKSSIDAKLIVAGLVSNGFSIADPADGGSLDVVGFDTNVPALIADFVTDGKNTQSTQED